MEIVPQRTFPQTVESGDVAVAIYNLVDIPGYTDGAFVEGTDPADVYTVYFSLLETEGESERAIVGTISASKIPL